MVCKMAKKGLAIAALTAAGLGLAFGTSAPSYVKTAFHKVRQTAKDSVPIPFEIERAKQEIAGLDQVMLDFREVLARAEVDVEQLQREIAETEKNLAGEQRTMLSLRNRLESGDLRLAKNSNIQLTIDEVKGELAHKLDRYKNVSQVLANKQLALKARQKTVESARTKLNDMVNAKRDLATKIEAIQAKNESIEASQVKNDFNFDDSALARAKETVAELEKRLEVKARVAEMEGHFTGAILPEDSDRDVIKEFDSQFGCPDSAPKTGSEKKSL